MPKKLYAVEINVPHGQVTQVLELLNDFDANGGHLLLDHQTGAKVVRVSCPNGRRFWNLREMFDDDEREVEMIAYIRQLVDIDVTQLIDLETCESSVSSSEFLKKKLAIALLILKSL